MAITYPRDLPTILETKCEGWTFDFEPLGELSRAIAGDVSFQERVGGNLWQLSLQTKPLNETDYSALHAWFLSLRGGSKSFKAYDVRRCYPLAYPKVNGVSTLPATRHGGGAFDGTATLTAAGGTTISLSGLPTSYVVSPGDYVSFDWLGGRALVRAVEAKTAALGVIAGLEVAPWLLAGGTVPVTCSLVRAYCLMVPVTRSLQADRKPGTPIGFDAVQTLPTAQ